jgi:DnaJ-class molecular chaperone
MVALLVLVTVIVVGYLISIRLHPFTTCRRCNGTNKHQGAIYSYAFRRCRRCKGTGRKVRFGARVLGTDQ